MYIRIKSDGTNYLTASLVSAMPLYFFLSFFLYHFPCLILMAFPWILIIFSEKANELGICKINQFILIPISFNSERTINIDFLYCGIQCFIYSCSHMCHNLILHLIVCKLPCHVACCLLQNGFHHGQLTFSVKFEEAFRPREIV